MVQSSVCTRSWRRARIRSGRGTSPNSRAPIPYRYYSLYVILDLFSRYAVGWMVARHAECAPGGAPDCGDLPEAGHRPAPTHHSCGPRRAHAKQARQRCSSQIWTSTPGHIAAAREQRQSVLRSAVPDREVPAGVSRPVRLACPRVGRQPRFDRVDDAHHHSGLSYLTPAAVHDGRARRSSRSRHARAWTAVRGSSGSSKGHHVQTLPTAVCDQSAAETDPRGCPGATPVTPSRPPAWGDPPGFICDDRPITLVTSVGSRDAESGCLKGVDTARSRVPYDFCHRAYGLVRSTALESDLAVPPSKLTDMHCIALALHPRARRGFHSRTRLQRPFTGIDEVWISTPQSRRTNGNSSALWNVGD